MALTGTIKTFGGHKGFGFIVSDQAEGDVYFQDRDLPPGFQGINRDVFKLEGCVVTFDLHQSADGKPQARGVQVVSLTADDGTETLFGEVKSFSDLKGFGFITCSQLEGDVFFHAKELAVQQQGYVFKGCTAAFQLVAAEDGKMQARQVRILGGGHAGGMGFAAPAALQSQTPAWSGSMLAPRQAALVPSRVGGSLVAAGKGGTVRLVTAGSAAATPGLARRASSAPVLVPRASSAQMVTVQRGSTRGAPPNDGEVHAGVVKSYDPVKGFGFINNSNLPMDIYFKGPVSVEAGTQVSFTMKWTPDGRPQAWDVQPQVADGSSVAGTIKSISDKNGYGFISSPQVKQDLYFKKTDMAAALQANPAELLTGLQVRCVVKLHADGKPTAVDIQSSGAGGAVPRVIKRIAGGVASGGGLLVPQAKRLKTEGHTWAQAEVGGAMVQGDRGLEGEIKSYNPVKGWGFLSSASTSGDVYFKQHALPAELRHGVEPGQQVVFDLLFTPDGKPQGTNIQPL